MRLTSTRAEQMNRVWILPVVLFLSGCMEDKARDVAACDVDAMRVYPKQADLGFGDPRTVYINACMASKGYDFTILGKGCRSSQALPIQPDCYTPRGWFGRMLDQLSRPSK